MLIQMRKHLENKRAQSTLEYAILIAVVVGALIALNLYMRRAVSGKLRESADDVGTQYDIKTGAYTQRSQLKDTEGTEQEVTHSMMNVTPDNRVVISDDGVKGNMGWRSATRVYEGTEAQWTAESAVRELDEKSTTDGAAILSK